MTRLAWVALILGASALAADTDDRGWTTGGTAAVDAQKVIQGVAQRPVLDFPRHLTDRIDGETVLFYFSPTCPHCRHVAEEVQALSDRLAGRARVLGVASGSATEAELAEFRATFGVTFDLIVDTERDIMAAMAVRSTPSAMLVSPKAKGKLDVHDLWYPYLPGWDAMVEGRVLGDIWKVFRPGEYLGNNVCGSCHGQEHRSWTLTHHAIAWRTLQKQDAHTNSECTGCHVTGAGQPTGWDGDDHSPLVDVGCEACHGPGGPHDGERVDARTTCATCHDEKHSIAFSVEKGLPLIDHFRGNALTEAEIDERRRALYDGQAPRELLAFPEGKNVGAATCRGCHAVEHAWWSDDAHARGMDSLRAEGSKDPACVRCHATAKQSGPPPTSMDGFMTLDGVGCESCHGPGADHVAAEGGTDNIQGLGESCPVCVLEALCTSCHTKEWDKTWRLEAKLPLVKHLPDD